MNEQPHHQPPSWGSWLILLLGGDSQEVSNLLGDVHELYARRVRQSGVFNARLRYCADLFSILRHLPFRKIKKPLYPKNNMSLLINYFKVAGRNLLRQKLHAGINMIGLSLGFTFCLIIFLYVAHELSYDRFHKNGENIYLLAMTWHFNGTALPTGANCSVGGPFMKDAFAEVDKTVRISVSSLSLLKGGEAVKEKDIYYADSTFLSIFSFPLLAGDPVTALRDPYSIVITKVTAEKYFGNNTGAETLLGLELIGTNGKTYTITGVLGDIPSNSHLQFAAVVSFSTLPVSRTTPSWDNSEFYTYLLLNKNADPGKIRTEIPDKLEKRFWKGSGKDIGLDLVPLNEIYLHNTMYKVPNTSNIIYVQVFSLAAFLVMVIATVNYINMATARSMERALEVGVRKVMGAQRVQLFYQFLSESVIVSTLSLLLAITFAWLLLPLFSVFAGKNLDLHQLITVKNVLIMLGGILLISLLSGGYPAFIVSAYNPAKVLKGKFASSTQGIRLREALVLGQFLISILLIISTLMVSEQISFIQSKDLGYDRGRLVSLSLDSISRTRVDVMKASLSSDAAVAGVAATFQLPTRITHQTALSLKGAPESERTLMSAVCVDSDFINTVGLKLSAGKGFTHGVENTSDTWEILINESAAEFFGWSGDEAVGKEMQIWQVGGTVTGVVKNFHFSSLHNPIAPLVIFSGKAGKQYSHLLVNVSGSPSDIRNSLESAWRKVNQDSPFQITFLDDQYESLYDKEAQLRDIINVFSVVAILISILGLFGLSSYSILQRTKELGVRKVLGASVKSLIGLVSHRFIRLVITAFILAVPVSWYVMDQWLSRFAYHISFNWLTVTIAGLATIMLALFTVSYHAIEAARVNPAETLRSQ